MIPVPYCYPAYVVSVYDADTITVNIDQGFKNWILGEKIRLSRINAYEIRLSKSKGVTPAQKKKGLKGRDYLDDLINNKYIIIKTIKEKVRGKFGRVLAEVYFQDDKGKWYNVNDQLVKLGHAKYQKY